MSDEQVEVLGKGRFLCLVRRDGWEYTHRVDSEGVVVLVAVTEEGKLILVEQHRGAVGKSVVELPAGLAGDDAEKSGEALEQAARRELLEETGYEAEEMVQLLEGPVSPGMTSETISVFRARGLRKVGPGGGDHTEDIEVHEVPVEEVESWIRERVEATGCAVDPKVFMGAFFARG